MDHLENTGTMDLRLLATWDAKEPGSRLLWTSPKRGDCLDRRGSRLPPLISLQLAAAALISRSGSCTDVAALVLNSGEAQELCCVSRWGWARIVAGPCPARQQQGGAAGAPIGIAWVLLPVAPQQKQGKPFASAGDPSQTKQCVHHPPGRPPPPAPTQAAGGAARSRVQRGAQQARGRCQVGVWQYQPAGLQPRGQPGVLRGPGEL